MTVKAYIPANSTSRFSPGQKAIVMFSIFSCRFIATLLFTDRPMPPRFIYPEKPFLGPGAYLGHVAGLGYSLDDETQWTTGLPAEFYHAFSYPGVFFGDRRTRSIFSVLKLFEYLGIFPAWQMFLALYYWSFFRGPLGHHLIHDDSSGCAYHSVEPHRTLHKTSANRNQLSFRFTMR